MKSGSQNNNVEEVKDTGNIKFSNLVSASITDTAIMLIISGVIFFVLQVVLRIAGYNIIKSYIGTFILIIFVIVSIFYSPIIRVKKAATIGENGAKLQLVKKETL